MEHSVEGYGGQNRISRAGSDGSLSRGYNDALGTSDEEVMAPSALSDRCPTSAPTRRPPIAVRLVKEDEHLRSVEVSDETKVVVPLLLVALESCDAQLDRPLV
jgi:hypothetical protein